MNGEANVLTADAVIFPVKPQEREVSKVKSIKIEETEVTVVETVQKEGRFARLKRSLRKRSASIL
jgi:hypothetical protein